MGKGPRFGDLDSFNVDFLWKLWYGEAEVSTMEFTLNGKRYEVLRFLGRGKGGYSYLVTDGHGQYTLKRIHHEPCDYYTFGDKLASELHDYETLQALGIPMPKLLAVDTQRERLLKEYLPGKTIFELVAEGCSVEAWLPQIRAMCDKLYPANLNIDYFPTNFIPRGDVLYYVDYECSPYMQKWDFEHWGIAYWSQTEAFLTHLSQKGATP